MIFYSIQTLPKDPIFDEKWPKNAKNVIFEKFEKNQNFQLFWVGHQVRHQVGHHAQP